MRRAATPDARHGLDGAQGVSVRSPRCHKQFAFQSSPKTVRDALSGKFQVSTRITAPPRRTPKSLHAAALQEVKTS